MGKTGGFLEHDRKDPGYRSVQERIGDYHAVEQRLDAETLHAQSSRCMECGTPFCHGTGCPLANVIPEFNDFVYAGLWKDAAKLLLRTNNFPEFTGRLCPAPCEASCVLGINDDPVTIRQIELEIIEKAFQEGFISALPPPHRSGKKIAVIGSGPAGLATADCLNRAGHSVVIFEAFDKAGGIMRYGIPDFKMEKWIIDRRLDIMQQEGIVIETGVTAGDDISFNYLTSRFDAICLAGGSRQPRDLKIPGRDLDGIHYAMEYLICQNHLNDGKKIDHPISASGKNVVVIGGGDTGSDCVGTAIRQGAANVVQFEIMPKPSTERPSSTPWPLWPQIMRESSSHQEGCQRHWSVSAKQFEGNGNINSLQYTKVECSKTPDGQLVFSDVADSQSTQKADLVLLAMGFVGPGPNKLVEDRDLKLDPRGNVAATDSGMTSENGIFVAGDMTTGQSIIVRAIASGRKCAEGIAIYLGQK